MHRWTAPRRSVLGGLARRPVRVRPQSLSRQEDRHHALSAAALRQKAISRHRLRLGPTPSAAPDAPTRRQLSPRSGLAPSHSLAEPRALTDSLPAVPPCTADALNSRRESGANVRAPAERQRESPREQESAATRLAHRLMRMHHDETALSHGGSAAVSNPTRGGATPAEEPLLQRQTSPQPRHAFRRAALADAEMCEDGSHTLLASMVDGSSTTMGLDEEDVVLDTPVSLLRTLGAEAVSAAPGRTSVAVSTAQLAQDAKSMRQKTKSGGALQHESTGLDALPSARGASDDIVEMVTDAFAERREKEVEQRRRALYELTHPTPTDYTYNGRLVPPPPLSFGRVTDEAMRLGEQLMLQPSYSLVRAAGVRARGDGEGQSATVATAAEDTPMIELGATDGRRGRLARQRTAVAPYRSRRREDNVFRDHNYFFEVNELYQEIVLVGRACAGKSSLINALLGQRGLAKTSSTPHTTRQLNFYQSVSAAELHAFHAQEHHNQLVKLPGGGLQLTFVDVPGYGLEGMGDKWRDAAIELTDAYFGVRRSVNTVLFCIDCERGMTKTDIKYFQWLQNVQGVFYIVLTKCDSVPHSRVCSVMRQLYVLITGSRRKYRAVFPFILPVSARDGTNMDVLRGLIAETSGMMPGDKLRDLLKHNKDAAMQEGLAHEARRLAQARQIERETARAAFLEQYADRLPRDSPLLLPAPPSLPTDEATAPDVFSVNHRASSQQKTSGSGSPSASTPTRAPALSSRAVYSLDLTGSRRATQQVASGAVEARGGPALAGQAAAVGPQGRQRTREEFLSWRAQNPLETVPTPYGAVRYRLNTGLENPSTASLTLEYDPATLQRDAVAAREVDGLRERGNDSDGADAKDGVGVEDEGSARLLAAAAPSSRVLGLPSSAGAVPAGHCVTAPTGRVSQFLDTLERFSHQSRPEKHLDKWRRNGALRPRLLAEDADGRLVGYRGGRRQGPAKLSAADADTTTRQAAWRGQQLKALLWQENAAAPWEAVQSLARKLEHEKQQRVMQHGMARKEREAFCRNAGKVTESFQRFEGEVTAAKYMNESRQAPTLRSQQQMHFNATAKISYRAMPPGLWRQYGQKDTYWPTPQVLGRTQDESHRP